MPSRFQPAAALAFAALALCGARPGHAADASDTLLLQQPDISTHDITFVYDNDIWIASRDGGPARRLTTAAGAESAPHFSPDGSLIAFSGNYDGNMDVYVMPVTGGAPVRLTWHGGPDIVQGFLPDGRVLFSSYRYLYTDRMSQLFAVPITGGMPGRIRVPDADDAQVAPDGSRIAYSTMPPLYKTAVPQAKNYRGGDASRIWIMDLDDDRVQQIPQPPGRSNDLNPVWLNGLIYFTSDRNGEFNLFRFDPEDARVEQLTHYADFPILNLNGGGGRLIYEQAGALHTFDPAAGKDRRLKIAAGADLREIRPRYGSDPRYVHAVAASPDLRDVALEYRGEIIILPTDGSPYRNLTRSTGANDRGPAWSPDGTRIAWFSDLSGEYALYVHSLRGTAGPRRIDLHGAGFYQDLRWSPDGRYLSYLDNSLSLYILDLQSGRSRRIAQESRYTPSSTIHYDWSPDSKWLAFTADAHGLMQAVRLYSLEQERSFAVSDALVDASEPVFGHDGDYLYVLGSIDAGPVRDWFTQSRAGLSITRTVYAIALNTHAPPLQPPAATEIARGARTKGDAAARPVEVTVELDGIERRALALGKTTGAIRNLQVGRAGEIYYLARTPQEGTRLMRYAPRLDKLQPLVEGVSDYRIAGGGDAILYQKGDVWLTAALGANIDEGTSRPLPVGSVSVLIEPRAEWPQIAREAWRIKRDYFYAPNFHGADWNAIWTKYAPFLAHAATRDDIARIQYWMSTELAVGHSYVFPGETIERPPQVSVGLLGADYVIDANRYRFAKIYGAAWTPGLAAPLMTPGAAVAPGEYLLKINGVELNAQESVYKAFQNTAGRPVVLTVGARPDGQGARQITTVPVDDEMMLRRIDWIEDNIRKVDAASGGRVAYVHVPDTANSGIDFFKRYFYPQSHKEAIIVDARFNGGGSFADYYIDILRRAYVGRFATRYGQDQRVPRGAIFGPKVLIANKMARSGGDLLAYMFRKLKLGPIVGTTTTGALVGNLGVPELMDGGVVTAPNFAFWSEAEGWAVENTGVAPDIEVEQWPAAVNAGHDPQLEQAIETALSLLPDAPALQPVHPDYPVRTRQPQSIGSPPARQAE